MDAKYILSNYDITNFIFGILTLYLLYRLSTKNHNFWLDKNIIYVKPLPILGSLACYWKATNTSVDLLRHKKYGRIYGYFEGTTPNIAIAEPKIIKNILVKDFEHFSARREAIYRNFPLVNKSLLVLTGEDWKRVRTAIAPSFTSHKLKRMYKIFEDCSQTLLQNLLKAADKDTSIDIIKYFGSFTMDIIASAAFSIKLDSHNDPENAVATNAREFFRQRSSLAFRFLRFCPDFAERYFSIFFMSRPIKFFEKIVKDIIRNREQTGQIRNDFLNLMLDLKTNVVEKEPAVEDVNDLKNTSKHQSNNPDADRNKQFQVKNLSEEEMLAACVTFFLAGYHSTSQTLGFTAYLLALNSHIQEKVFQEISFVLKETKGHLTYEAIEEMKYLDNVISESLRLYPSGGRIERICTKDYRLEDSGFVIPKGMAVMIPVFAIHRDPNLFSDPDKFNPDRFKKGVTKPIESYSYLPFGEGPRICTGMRFALLEMKVSLIYILSTFLIKPCSKTKVPLEFHKGLKLLRPKPIILSVKKRDLCPLNR